MVMDESAMLKTGRKKMKSSPPKNGNHEGYVPIDREIEHIHHFPVKKIRISPALGEKG